MSLSKESVVKVLYQFPTLFKKTSTGAVQFWQMEVSEILADGETRPVGELKTIYGQYGTSSPQETRDLISEGKNPGKKNETTPVEQALKEAEAQWTKKKKKGYVESIENAQNGFIDEEVIKGGENPMLAETYAKQGHKIVFPCFAQPKLDGIRCVAIVKNGQCTLWTRTRKPIHSVPHIVSAIEALFVDKNIILDGELYNHDLKEDFERIVSLIRNDEPVEGHTDVEYHIYDIMDSEAPFGERNERIKELNLPDDGPLVAVETWTILEESDIAPQFNTCLDEGYEGLILRNANAPYVNRRTPDLQKIKDLPASGQSAEEDAEFPIVAIKEGRGKLRGHVGSFFCALPGNKTFKVKLKGNQSRLKTFFEQHDLWKGKDLVVRFQGYTKEGRPRFPRGIRLRDSEDY